MVKVNFSGSASLTAQKWRKQLKILSIIKETGGEGYQTAKAYIKKAMVHYMLHLGDLYKGTFKNGLKHGIGNEHFGNRDYYKGEYVNGLP